MALLQSGLHVSEFLTINHCQNDGKYFKKTKAQGKGRQMVTDGDGV
jgi:hypothetical protein